MNGAGIGRAAMLRATVMVTTAAAALAMSGSSGMVAAQGGAASLRGVVTESDTGAPLVGITVELVEPGLRTVSDVEGRYVFARVPAGSYTLRLSRLGLTTWEDRVVVGSGAARVDVSLNADAVRLDPVQVLAGRTRLVGDPLDAGRIPGSAHVIDLGELREQKLLFDDVHAVLRQVPGVYVQEEEGFGLRPNIGLRGSGSERSSKITLMEDGVLIAPAPYAAPSAYYFPIVGRMEAVEVRKGSSQVRYGPRTTGGAINLVSTSIPDDFHVFADVAGGRDETGKAVVRVGDSYSNGGWLLETYQSGSDGYKQLDGGGDTGFRLQDYVGKFRVNSDRTAPGLYQELELKLGWYDQRSDETYLGLTEADFEESPLRRYAGSQADVMNADHSQIQLRYFLAPGGGLDITATAYRNEFARNWYKLGNVGGVGISGVLANPADHAPELEILRGGTSADGALAVRANNREYLAQGIQGSVGTRFSAGGTHDLEIGVRVHEDSEDRFQHDDRYRMDAGRMVLTSAGAPGSQANRVSEAAAWALYIQDRIELGSLTLVPGVRYEDIRFTRTDYAGTDPERTSPTRVRENDVQVWIPGVGMNLQVRPDLQLFGGVHRGFGPPGPGADAATRPETSINYELGTRFAAAGLTAELVGFVGDYDNILGVETLAGGTGGEGDVFNGGAVSVRGVEASAAYDALRGSASGLRAPLQVAYTYTDAEFLTSFESDFDQWGTVTAGDELPYLPEHQLHASGSLDAGRWAAGLRATYSAPMRTRAGQGPLADDASTDEFLVFGLSGEYRAVRWGTVYAGIENLTDRRYVVARHPAGLRPGLPRTVHVGIRMAR